MKQDLTRNGGHTTARHPSKDPSSPCGQACDGAPDRKRFSCTCLGIAGDCSEGYDDSTSLCRLHSRFVKVSYEPWSNLRLEGSCKEYKILITNELIRLV